MSFYIAALIIAIACSIITIRTLIGYVTAKRTTKVLISLAVVSGWIMPLLIGLFRKTGFLTIDMYNSFAEFGYIYFGFVFILFSLLILRDIFWYLLYAVAKLLRIATWEINPKNINVLGKANFLVIICSFLFSYIAFNNASEIPEFKNVSFQSDKVKEDFKFAVVSDLHVTSRTSVEDVKAIVEKINAQNLDAVLLLGDIIDDDIARIHKQLAPLKDLKAKHGVFAVMGNHELYNGINTALLKYRALGAKLLYNNGAMLGDTNIYVSGIPDYHTAMISEGLSVNFEKTLRNADANSYRILMSHNPEFVEYIDLSRFDLQVSGHTHGGQIFPFHIFAKHVNKYLAGEYKVNGLDLYVSRGTGFWGPKMRLFAPAEITLIEIKSKK